MALLLVGINIAPTILLLAAGINSGFEPWVEWSKALLLAAVLWAAPGIIWLMACKAADAEIRQKVQYDEKNRAGR